MTVFGNKLETEQNRGGCGRRNHRNRNIVAVISQLQHRKRSRNMARTATIVRETSESKVELSLNLDGTGKTDIDTSVPFYNHIDDGARQAFADRPENQSRRGHRHRRAPYRRRHRHRIRRGSEAGPRRQAWHPPFRRRHRAARRGAGQGRGRHFRPPVLRVHRRAGRLRILHDWRAFYRFARSPRHGIHRHACRHLPAPARDFRPRPAPHRRSRIQGFGPRIAFAIEPDPRVDGIPSTKGAL